MPIRLKNPFGKTKKKRKLVVHHKKPLLSSGERERMTLYKKLRSDERKKSADMRLGNSLKGSFEKYLATQKKRSGSKKKKRKTKKKRKSGSKK